MLKTSEHHFRNSTYREKIVEHIFIGELLRYFWSAGLVNVEILKPEVDSNGYDLVITYGMIVRHIQLKTSLSGSSTAKQNINKNLANHISGCVIWIILEADLSFQKFLWFGGSVGEKLPSLEYFSKSKHTRANAEGVKKTRENTVVLPKGAFTPLEGMDELLLSLIHI